MNGSEKLLVIIVCLLGVAYALVQNPIRFHQTVRLSDTTMQVPLFWTPVKNPDGRMLVALRREWAWLGTVDVMDRTKFGDRFGEKKGPWTLESAHQAQVTLVPLQAKDGRFSDPKVFDLPAGRFTAVCEEATFGGGRALTCYIVGTPLQFSYLGSIAHEADARKMLASLQ
jgi:hypothetical protein